MKFRVPFYYVRTGDYFMYYGYRYLKVSHDHGFCFNLNKLRRIGSDANVWPNT